MKRIVDSIVRFLVVLLRCRLLLDHDWTCAAEQNIPPTAKQLADGVDGFFDYAKMYCRRCGHEAEISRKHRGAE